MQHILLLHGALGADDQLRSLSHALAGKFHVHSFNFSGHGGRLFPAEPFSIPLFSNQIMEYMQEKNITAANIFGYSMGDMQPCILQNIILKKLTNSSHLPSGKLGILPGTPHPLEQVNVDLLTHLINDFIK